MKEILAFLSELKNNNNRDWFQANKDWYVKVKEEHEKFVRELIDGVALFDKEVQLLNPAESTFRIYRDVRFSKNKDPYKTALGAVVSKGGRKSKFAGYYVHLEPGNSFAGGGIWRPSSDVLKSVRYEIYNYPDEFISIINQKEFKKHFGEISGEKLTRPPKDFPADFDQIEYLKYKSFTVGEYFENAKVEGEDFIKNVLTTFGVMKPFVKFLNRGIENL